jgi:hypothetical protein
VPHARHMPNTAAAPRRLAAAALMVLAVLGVLLAATPASAASTADRLDLSWTDGNATLVIQGYGYQPDGAVAVALGGSTIQQTRSDRTGRVQVLVPSPAITAGRPGVSIVLTGRAVSGTSRILVSSVPPRAAVHGAVDRLPVFVGLGVLVVVALEVVHRRRVRRRAAALARSAATLA